MGRGRKGRALLTLTARAVNANVDDAVVSKLPRRRFRVRVCVCMLRSRNARIIVVDALATHIAVFAPPRSQFAQLSTPTVSPSRIGSSMALGYGVDSELIFL